MSEQVTVDNSGHFPGIVNYPDHKHVGEEANAASAEEPTLAKVIEEIEASFARGSK